MAKRLLLAVLLLFSAACAFSTPSDHYVALSSEWELPVGGRIVGLPVEGPTGDISFLCDNRFIYTVTPSGNLVYGVNTYQSFSGLLTVAGDGAFYVAVGRNTLMAVNTAGEIRWKRRFDSGVGKHILPGPGGELYLLTDNGILYSITAAGTERWRTETGLHAALPIGMDKNGRILIPGEDDFLHLLLPWGPEVWKFRLSGKPLVYAFYKDGILCSTASGTLVCVNAKGVQVWQLALNERITDLVHDGDTIYGITEKGSILSITEGGSVLWNVELSSAGKLFLAGQETIIASEDNGGISLIGANGHVFGRIDTNVPTDAGVLSREGSFVRGGRDWIVYGYSAPKAVEGWNQSGGNSKRNWSVLTGGTWRHWLSFFEKDPDFLTIDALVSYGLNERDPDAIERSLKVLNDTASGDERFLREPYIMYFLERVITQHITELSRTIPAKDYPGLRIHALDILGKMETTYSNEIYIVLFEHERDTSVLLHALNNFKNLPGDPGGKLSRAISQRLLTDNTLGDDFRLTALDALLAAARYRGRSSDPAVTEAAIHMYRESRNSAVKRKSLLLLKY